MPDWTPATGGEHNARYGARHRNIRRQWRPLVRAGQVLCARCGVLIAPDERWDLGHVPGSRTEYAGPMHERCNRDTVGSGERGASMRHSGSTTPQVRDPNPPRICGGNEDHHRYYAAGRLATQTDNPVAMICVERGHMSRWASESMRPAAASVIA